MQYIYEYNIATMGVVVVLALLYFMRQNYPNHTHRLFLILMANVFTCALTDTISVFTLAYPYSIPVFLNYIINIGYLLSFNFTTIFFYSYVIAIVDRRGKKFARIVRAVAAVIIAGLVLTTPFTKWVIYFDENRIYTHGPLFPILYGIAFFILVCALVSLIRGRKKLDSIKVISVVFFIVAMVGVVILQMFIQGLLLSDFVMVLFLLMVYFILQSSDSYVHASTECFNASAFAQTADRFIRKERRFAVVGCTIDEYDYFKKIYGLESEKFILFVGRRLKKAFGKKYVYALSESRFLILTRKPEEVVQRIMNFCENYEFEGYADIDFSPNFCIVRYPDYVTSGTDIINTVEDVFSDYSFSADERVLEAPKEVMEKRNRRANVVHAIRKAIANESFEVYFQPIYHVVDGKFHSLEALLRLIDDELGFIPPDEFIPLAEETGLIVSVEHIAFKKTCAFIRENKIKSLGVDYVEFNLSGVEFGRSNLAERILDHLKAYGVEPEQLNIEITETARMFRGETQINTMQKLIEAGSTFSMDDYGTGYSSMEYLLELPVTIVKMDKSLLWSAVEDKSGLIMLKHMAKLLKDIGKKIVVEGVETPQMIELCKENGCDYLQGFYFSKPVPPRVVLEFLKEHNL